MPIRRCAILYLEPRETVAFDLDLLLQGESGLRSTLQWFALAPHLGREVEVGTDEREALGAIGDAQWSERDALGLAHGAGTIDALLAKGLLVAQGSDHAQRDAKIRDTHWRGLSAASHLFGRWEGVDAGEAAREAGLATNADMAERYGEPPPHFHARGPASARIALSRPRPNTFDQLLQRRTTCRNFDAGRALDAARFSHLMHTVFAAQATRELAPNSAVVKKSSPSGGGLHPTEAYVLVQRVEGIAPGLYHYHSGEHALEPIATPPPTEPGASAPASGSADPRALATSFVAGQHWFADAPVLLVLAARFRRCFWKYRNHAKAYRALILDAGHLSQTLYLAATELGLGAFVTSAINEVEIERAFGLDPLDEGPLAVCGFGWRAQQRVTLEFDPLHQVWPPE
jgi:putative peptide maturation dehydrogenase